MAVKPMAAAFLPSFIEFSYLFTSDQYQIFPAVASFISRVLYPQRVGSVNMVISSITSRSFLTSQDFSQSSRRQSRNDGPFATLFSFQPPRQICFLHFVYYILRPPKCQEILHKSQNTRHSAKIPADSARSAGK